jgi:biopolymer transport protein ExbB
MDRDRSARLALLTSTVTLALILVLTPLCGRSAFGFDDGQAPDPPAAPTTTSPESNAPAPLKGASKTRSAVAGAGAGNVGKGSVLRVFTQANPMLWPLVLCSVVTLGYALERLVALRRERVIPRDFVARFLERLSGGKLDRDRATELCRANESPVARVFAQVVSYWGQPAATIRQALGYDAAGEVADLKRNVRVLNGTATLAPLLGLLGTVVGMIQSFDALGGRVGSARGEALAHGISLALVTTAAGLVIAAVSVTAYYYLLNRVDVLVRELDDNARKVIDLVSSEAIRPTSLADRRPSSSYSGPIEHPRHESRTH